MKNNTGVSSPALHTKPDIHNASIAYSYFCTVFKDSVLFKEKERKIEYLKKAISSRFTGCCFEDSPDADSHPYFQDLRTVENFLHGDGIPFECFRIYLDDFTLKHDFVDIASDNIVISFYHEVNILQFTLNICVRNCSLSTLVYLHQIHCPNPVFALYDDSVSPATSSVAGESAAEFGGFKTGDSFDYSKRSGSGTWLAVSRDAGVLSDGSVRVSVEGLFESIMQSLSLNYSDVEKSYLIELKDFFGYDSVDEIAEKYAKTLYGLITGDEGWDYVPETLARSRMEYSWGSREFMRLYSFGPNFLFLNLTESSRGLKYLNRQEEYGTSYYGSINPYFLLDSPTAGVTHGILFSLEVVMVIKTISNRILHRQEEFQKSGSQDFSRDIKKTKDYRRELITTLSKVENISMTELGELEYIILQSQRITPVIDKLKYLLELLESELDLLLQTNTNRLVNILTIAGLLLALVEVIQGML